MAVPVTKRPQGFPYEKEHIVFYWIWDEISTRIQYQLQFSHQIR